MPAWISAGVTSVAAGVAAVTYWRNERVRSKAQARLVYASVDTLQRYEDGEEIPGADHLHLQGALLEPTSWPAGQDRPDGYFADGDWARATVRLHNLSDELVSKWGVTLQDRYAGDVYGVDAHVHGEAEPGGVTTRVYLFPLLAVFPGEPEITVHFRDASGRWWERHESDPIRRARKRAIPTLGRAARRWGGVLLSVGSLEPWERRPWHRLSRRYRLWVLRRRRDVSSEPYDSTSSTGCEDRSSKRQDPPFEVDGPPQQCGNPGRSNLR